MNTFHTPETFNPEKYKRTSWVPIMLRSEFDGGRIRLVVRVATGRKYWPLFSVLPNFEIGINDPVLKEIKFSLNSYTHPMIGRFINELNIMLTDLYKEEIDLYKIESGINMSNYHSSHNF